MIKGFEKSNKIEQIDIESPTFSQRLDSSLSAVQTPDVLRQPQSIKVDALYKPLLRRFRSTLRKEFEADKTVKRFMNLKTSEFIEQVTTFMREQVGVPNELLDAESVDKMLIILFPCITSRPAY